MKLPLFRALAALVFTAGEASALTADEISVVRGFEGEWGLAAVTPKTAIQNEALDGRAECGAPLALNIRVLPDEYEPAVWRLYSAPGQSLGSRIVGVGTEGTLQRVTAERFAPIGSHTETYDRTGNILLVTVGLVQLTYKRC